MWGGTAWDGGRVVMGLVRACPGTAQARRAGALGWPGVHHLGHETCMELVHEL